MELKHLKDPSQIKFLCIYAKDERFQTLFNRYLMDKLKTSTYAFREPTNQDELSEAIVFSGVAPLGYSRWVTSVNTDKVKINKALASQMIDNEYSTNLIFSTNFKSHKIMKRLFSFPQKDFLEITFATLNMDKMFILQDLIVPKSNRLETPILNKVLKGYRTRPEKVLDLFYHLVETPLKEYKDIILFLGSPDNTMEKLVLKLLDIEIKSTRSFNTQMRNRYKDIEDLVLQIGYENLVPYMKHTLKDIMYIKGQYQAGVLYRSVTKQKIEYKRDGAEYESEVDITYIKRNLSKYIDTIMHTPTSRILHLYGVLNNTPRITDSSMSYKFILDYLLSLDTN